MITRKKIAISGKIASGKSTLSKYIQEKYNFTRIGYGDAVKKFAKEIFNMEYKDRQLLQDFAQSMRSIDEDVWVKIVERHINNTTENILVDDLRFPNELESLNKMGFTIIKIELDIDLQKERIKNTYPTTFIEHYNRLNDISESYINELEVEYTFNMTKENEKKIFLLMDNIILG